MNNRLVSLAVSLVWCVVTPCGLMAQDVGTIFLFTDPGFLSCELATDSGPDITLYVVHDEHFGVRGAHYRIGECNSTLTYVGEHTFFPSTGSADVGVNITYGVCLGGTVLLQEVYYYASPPLPVDSGLEVLPAFAALSGTIEAVGCDNIKGTAEGKVVCVGCVDLACWCILGETRPCYTCVPPVTPTTVSSWGKIKALYR